MIYFFVTLYSGSLNFETFMYNKDNVKVVDKDIKKLVLGDAHRSSDYNKLSILYNIRDRLEQNLMDLYATKFNSADFDTAFDRKEGDFMTCLNLQQNPDIEDTYTVLRNSSLSVRQRLAKNYINLILIKKLKANQNKFYRILYLYDFFLKKRLKFYDKYYGDLPLKPLNHLCKLQAFHGIKAFKAAFYLPFIKTNEILAVRFFKFFTLSLLSIIGGSISILVSAILLLLNGINTCFNKASQNKKDKFSNKSSSIFKRYIGIATNISGNMLAKIADLLNFVLSDYQIFSLKLARLEKNNTEQRIYSRIRSPISFLNRRLNTLTNSKALEIKRINIEMKKALRRIQKANSTEYSNFERDVENILDVVLTELAKSIYLKYNKRRLYNKINLIKEKAKVIPFKDIYNSKSAANL